MTHPLIQPSHREPDTMSKIIRIPFRLLSLAAVVCTLVGCETTPGADKPPPVAQSTETGPADAVPAPPPDTQPAEPPEPAAAKDVAKDDADAEKKKAEELEKQEEEDARDARELAKQERNLAIAEASLEKTKTAQANARLQMAVSLARVEKELEFENQRLKNFLERQVPVRIARAKLGVTRWEDRVKEAEEELKQLETMYAQEDFADHTKEIVLERGRRRLERDRTDLELRREDLVTLTERTIPLETTEYEFRVEQKAKALEKTRRDAEAAELDHKIALMRAEADIATKIAELAAFRLKIEKKKEKREQESEPAEAPQE
jgi:hypothetical protein